MGAPKPCLGYPSRTAAIRALRAQGHGIAQIAAQVGIATGTVSALELSDERHHGRSRPDYRPRSKRLPREVIDQILTMRERGLTGGQIQYKLAAQGIDVSVAYIDYRCTMEGADYPDGHRQRQRKSAHKPGATYERHGRLVRCFTPDEDAEILRLDAQGLRLAEIARNLDRRWNSVRHRLALLARNQERAEASERVTA